LNAGLPLLQPESVKDPQFLAAMKAVSPDIALTAAYGQILTRDFLTIPKRATINIHPSLLPRHRGAVPVPAALLAGDSETGVTVLFTVRKLDAGHIILQEKTLIDPDTTAELLLRSLFLQGARMIVPALTKLADPHYEGTPQDESHATHCRKIEKDDGRVDWNDPPQVIVNKYRAFEPWPGTFTYAGDRRIALAAVSIPVSAAISPLKPGQFTFDKRQKVLLVGCGDHCCVAVKEVRPAGGKHMDAASFWNGLKDRDHTFFTSEARP